MYLFSMDMLFVNNLRVVNSEINYFCLCFPIKSDSAFSDVYYIVQNVYMTNN